MTLDEFTEEAKLVLTRYGVPTQWQSLPYAYKGGIMELLSSRWPCVDDPVHVAYFDTRDGREAFWQVSMPMPRKAKTLDEAFLVAVQARLEQLSASIAATEQFLMADRAKLTSLSFRTGVFL